METGQVFDPGNPDSIFDEETGQYITPSHKNIEFVMYVDQSFDHYRSN